MLGGLPARTFTWSHTLGGGDSQAIVVGVSTYSTLAVLPAVKVTGVRIVETNQAFTRVDDGLGVSSDSKAGVDMFILKEPLPPPGTYTIEVTLGAGVEYAVGGSVSFNGVNQTTPNRTFVAATNRATGTSANPTIATVPSAANEIVVDTVGTAFGATPNILTPAAGQTERWNGKNCDGPPPANEPNLTLNSIGAGSTKTGSTTTTMSWTQTNSQPWVIEAISLQPLAPTAVDLASFDAARTTRGVLLRWKTGYEVNNLGFNLYRDEKGKRTRVNPSLIAGSAISAGQGTRLTAGQSYTWLDRSAGNKEAAQYWLEDIDLDGTRHTHGPITAAANDNAVAATADEQAALLAGLGQSSSANAFVRGYPAAQDSAALAAAGKNAKAAAASSDSALRMSMLSSILTPTVGGNGSSIPTSQDTAAAARGRALASGQAVKIAVRQAGWYRVTQADLLAAGLGANLDPSLLQLYADGVEQPLLQNGDKKQFNSSTSIEFYGTGMDTLTSDTRTYWLVLGTSSGKRITGPNDQKNSNSVRVDRDISWLTTEPKTSATATHASANPAQAVTRPVPLFPPAVYITRNVPGSSLLQPGKKEETAVNTAANTKDETAAAAATTSAETANTAAAPEVAATREPAAKAEAAAQPVVAKAAPKGKRKKAVRKRKTARVRSSSVHRSHASSFGSQDMEAEHSAEGFVYTLERKDRTVYFSSLLNGERENFFGPVITATPVKQTIGVTAIDKTMSAPATLELSLQGGTTGQHEVRVDFNGAPLGVVTFDGQSSRVRRFQMPRTSLIEGDNTVTLTALGGDSDVSVIDYVRLTYWRSYRAEKDQLTFTSPHTTPITIDGFTNAQIRVFDITDPSRIEQVAAKVSSKGAGYAVEIPGGQSYMRTLVALTDAQVARPASITANEPSAWARSDNRADFVILTHEGFQDAVKPLADLRRNQGMEVAIINVEDIYDEFSYGAHSRAAVSDFFAWAKANWQKSPGYALLVGDASSDPRNYMGTNRTDFVPTRMVDTKLFETASDDALFDADGDGISDIAIGRLPVQSLAQAQKVLAKITGYVPGQSADGALLVSDHLDGYDFEDANRQVRELLPATMSVTVVNRGNRSADEVRTEIVSAINQGPQLVNYAGHGSVEVWTGAGILRSEDKSSLTNGNRLPFFLSMTCLNGFFQDLYTESLAEALLRAENGGAVAVWASSGLTEPDRQALMDQQLIKSLFAGDAPAIGDAVRSAKQATTDMDVRRTWILFGDPTMRIR